MKHKFAIFGTGLMASIYGELIRQRSDVDLIGAVGNSPEKTSEFASRFGIEGYPRSQYDEFLRQHPEIDTVIIATPEWVRDGPITAAVQNRRNILLEKPFADSWKEALQFFGRLQGFGRVFQLCHVLRHSPRFYAMRQAVLSGQIGSTRHIYARRNSNNVRVQRVLGKTDLAFWLTSHDIDIIRWITNHDIEQVYAVSRTKLSTSDDYLIANLHLSNGIDAIVEISWCGPAVSASARDAVFEVRGTKGHIELEDFEMNVKVFVQDERVKVPDTYEHYDLHGQKSGYFRNMISDFIRSLDEPSMAETSLADALEATRVCAMIRKSLDENRIVHRAEFL